MLKALSAKGPVERMVRVVELDEDVLVLRQMGSPAPAEHVPELRPGFLGPIRKIGERHRGAVDAQQPATGQDELQQVLPKHRIGEQIADRVVQAHGVELTEVLLLKYGRVVGDFRRERAGLLAHAREGVVRVGNGTVSAVPDIPVVDEQLATRSGRGRCLCRQRGFHLLFRLFGQLRGVDSGP